MAQTRVAILALLNSVLLQIEISTDNITGVNVCHYEATQKDLIISGFITP